MQGHGKRNGKSFGFPCHWAFEMPMHQRTHVLWPKQQQSMTHTHCLLKESLSTKSFDAPTHFPPSWSMRSRTICQSRFSRSTGLVSSNHIGHRHFGSRMSHWNRVSRFDSFDYPETPHNNQPAKAALDKKDRRQANHTFSRQRLS